MYQKGDITGMFMPPREREREREVRRMGKDVVILFPGSPGPYETCNKLCSPGNGSKIVVFFF